MKSLQSYISDRKKKDKAFAKDYDKGYQDFKISVTIRKAR